MHNLAPNCPLELEQFATPRENCCAAFNMPAPDVCLPSAASPLSHAQLIQEGRRLERNDCSGKAEETTAAQEQVGSRANLLNSL